MGDGGDGTHPFANGGGDDGAESTGATGTGYETSIANFPGPKYGLPGYKESHKWESGAILPSLKSFPSFYPPCPLGI